MWSSVMDQCNTFALCFCLYRRLWCSPWEMFRIDSFHLHLHQCHYNAPQWRLCYNNYHTVVSTLGVCYSNNHIVASTLGVCYNDHTAVSTLGVCYNYHTVVSTLGVCYNYHTVVSILATSFNNYYSCNTQIVCFNNYGTVLCKVYICHNVYHAVVCTCIRTITAWSTALWCKTQTQLLICDSRVCHTLCSTVSIHNNGILLETHWNMNAAKITWETGY